MSKRNGDRSRFQINRKRKVRSRQRVQAMLKAALAPAASELSGATPVTATATKRRAKARTSA
jgi:hypothetical protein